LLKLNIFYLFTKILKVISLTRLVAI